MKESINLIGELFLSVRTAMWSMPVILTEWENENDLQNRCESCESMQCYVILQNDVMTYAF